MHQLEAHAAAGKVVEGIAAVFPLGVQHRHGLREFLLRQVVVADYHVYSLAAGVLHLLNGLDAAVQGDYEVHARLRGVVDALCGKAVALVISVGDVEVHFRGEALDEGIDQRHGGGAVHVIVSVNQDFLSAGYGVAHALDGYVHVLHQEGVVQVVQRRAEEGAGLLEGLHSPLDQKVGQDAVNSKLGCEPGDLGCVSRFLEYPFTFFGHFPTSPKFTKISQIF